MSAMAKMLLQTFYRQADGRPERLPWHRENPGRLLTSVVDARHGRGRALDVGCGAGVFSVWLAERGMEVTGLDLFPEAIAMARSRAEKRGVRVGLVCGNLFSCAPAEQFDVVFDSGCLHSLVGGDVASYKQQLLRWLAPGGEYVLGHWGKRHLLDWRPIGPRRRSPAWIERTFAPELELIEKEVADFAIPFPIGPTARGVDYRFRHRAPGSSSS